MVVLFFDMTDALKNSEPKYLPWKLYLLEAFSKSLSLYFENFFLDPCNDQKTDIKNCKNFEVSARLLEN
jgi:hypothetical protein